MFLTSSQGWSQPEPGRVPAQDAPFFEVGLHAGSIVPNHQPFPSIGLHSGGHIATGKRHQTSDWGAWYNFPTTGVQCTFSDYGNPEVYGTSISVYPFIELYAGDTPQKAWIFKVGLGASRFSTPYDSISNPDNIVVGSRYTWAFHAYLGRNLRTTPNWQWRVYGGFLHGSNGHVQLPNFGINSAVLTLAGRYKRAAIFPVISRPRQTAPRTKRTFAWFRAGLGIHEYGGTIGPVGTPKRPVYATSLGVGVLWRRHLRVRTGFTYQLYTHYEDQIRQNQYPEYIDNPRWNASNIHYFLACEFLMGHVGIDVEGGLNLYKPFFAQWNRDFEGKDGINLLLKSLFPARLGLRVYAINTLKAPTWNAFAAAHISANFGEADYSGVSVGFLRYFGPEHGQTR